MDTRIATANALHRMQRQRLLATRFGPVAEPAPARRPAPVEAEPPAPMPYRSEAFAEDLLDAGPGAR